MRTLCAVRDIPKNGAKGFPSVDGAPTGIFVVRQVDACYVYENACPHVGTPLDWVPDKFLSHDGRHLICATHGAEFTIETGRCISGPCQGDYLTPIKAEIQGGIILIPDDA